LVQNLKTTIEESEAANVVVVLLISGLLFLAFGINRARVTSFKWGDWQAGTEGEAEEAPLQRLSAEPEKAIAVLEAADNDTAPPPGSQPTKAATRCVTLGNKTYPVYPLNAVPIEVLRDLFVNWPESVGKLPPDFSRFQYAARKPGQGNNPWIIKFADCSPIGFSYGRGGVRVKSMDEAA
jgi:hypothetical protein